MSTSSATGKKRANTRPVRRVMRSLLPASVVVLAAAAVGCSDDDTASAGAGGTGGAGGAAGTIETFKNPAEIVATNDVVVSLDVKPAAVSIDGETYCLRSYNGLLPGPTIRVPASANAREVRVDLDNQFQTADNQTVAPRQTYDFNTTNLHTHGLHVQPEMATGSLYAGDNVLLHLAAQESQAYRFDIDEDFTHEAGTFWYHPHVHGSTSIQVGNGMAGAMIVEGPVDEIPGIAAARERIFMLQHIPYEVETPLPANVACDDSTLSINDFETIADSTKTLVNGLVEPTLVVTPGSVERWRFVHGGVHNEMTLSFKAAQGDSCDAVTGEAFDLQQIAADGFTFAQKWTKTALLLVPGYRADVMLQAPDAEGLYCLLATSPSGPGGTSTTQVTLAAVVVEAGDAPSGSMPSDAELAAVAHPPLDCNGAVDGTQTTIFSQILDEDGAPCEGGPPGPGVKMNINCKAFDQESPRVLKADTVDEWLLSSEVADHPFHIHVNPFTVCSGTVDGQPLPFPHWRDTLRIREEDGVTKVRMSYDFYTGSFVSHCHKLNHEDSGMMELVTIAP